MLIQGREFIFALLVEFAQSLSDLGIKGRIQVIGGAAINYQYMLDRRATIDIDAVFSQDSRIAAIIDFMAEKYELDEAWINDSARNLIPFERRDEWVSILLVGTIKVEIAKPQMLLAMKMNANRGRRDFLDLPSLATASGITTMAEAQKNYEYYYSEELIPKESFYFLADWFTAQSLA
jgi:hypothetical protein